MLKYIDIDLLTSGIIANPLWLEKLFAKAGTDNQSIALAILEVRKAIEDQVYSNTENTSISNINVEDLIK